MAEPAHGIAVLIPAYNPDEKLLALLPRLKERFSRIVLVDDGSTEGRDIFPRAAPYVEKILVHGKNRGKGAALKTGFAYLQDAGVDALIVQDLSLLALAARGEISVPLHASTQCAIRDIESARRYAEAGFSRLIL